MKNKNFTIPEGYKLIEWFGDMPTVHVDESYHYQISDDFGTTLILSFGFNPPSIQTILKFGGEKVITVVHENADRLWFEEWKVRKFLMASFSCAGSTTELKIEKTPRIKLEWSSLSSP